MNRFNLSVYTLGAMLAVAPTWALGQEELDEAEIFFELNDTDGDLGIHGFADGDAWKELEIEAPNDRELMEIDVRSRLKRQGVTELFFESAEPCFPETCDPEDEPLDPARFFKRFPAGIYEIEVETLENEELESEIYLSHVIPAAPEVVSIGDDMDGIDEDAEEECWVSGKGAGEDVVVTWNAVDQSHWAKWAGGDEKTPLGVDGEVDVIYYEFVVEVDETDWKSASIIPPGDGVNSKTIPADFFALTADDADGEYKIEILVRVDNGEGNPGNKSAVETCFEYDN